MLPWLVLVGNVVSHATLIATLTILSNSARNVSFGVAIRANVNMIIRAGGVMLLIAANVMNWSVAITATDVDVSTAWRHDHVLFVMFMHVTSALTTKTIDHVSFVVIFCVVIMDITVKNATKCSAGTATMDPCVITTPHFQMMTMAVVYSGAPRESTFLSVAIYHIVCCCTKHALLNKY